MSQENKQYRDHTQYNRTLLFSTLSYYYCTWKSFWDDHAALFEITVLRPRNLLHRCYGQVNYAPRTTFVCISKTSPATIIKFNYFCTKLNIKKVEILWQKSYILSSTLDIICPIPLIFPLGSSKSEISG